MGDPNKAAEEHADKTFERMLGGHTNASWEVTRDDFLAGAEWQKGENAKLREALEGIIAESHSWVIQQDTAGIEMPIHKRYRARAKKALGDVE